MSGCRYEDSEAYYKSLVLITKCSMKIMVMNIDSLLMIIYDLSSCFTILPVVAVYSIPVF